MMGPIMCFEFESDEPAGLSLPSLTCQQPRAIFDGQHRARAAMRLLSSSAVADGVTVKVEETEANRPHRASSRLAPKAPLTVSGGSGGMLGRHADFDLIVEVYRVSSEAEIKKLYLEVNKGEVVKEIDLPDTLAPDLKSYIDGAVDKLTRSFPAMHKPSERCRPPHVHRDTLRNR